MGDIINILLLGIDGRMGKKIYQSLKKYGFNIKGFDFLSKKRDYVITEFDDVNPNDYDWLVDFSNEAISKKMTKLFLENGKNVISGTTGIDFDVLDEFRELAKKNNAKYIHRVNFAKSFCEFESLAKDISKKMQHNIIVESHDFSKADRPSGSALRLLKVLKLNPDDVLSIRANEPCPYHSLISSNEHEKIIITHQILSKDAFVEGFLDLFLKEVGV